MWSICICTAWLHGCSFFERFDNTIKWIAKKFAHTWLNSGYFFSNERTKENERIVFKTPLKVFFRIDIVLYSATSHSYEVQSKRLEAGPVGRNYKKKYASYLLQGCNLVQQNMFWLEDLFWPLTGVQSLHTLELDHCVKKSTSSQISLWKKGKSL